MKIVHILAGMEQTSGIAKVACRLADVQAARGHDVVIATTDCGTAIHPVRSDVRVVSWSRSWPRRLCHSSGMRRELPALLAGADVAIVHSMWMWPVWFGAACARRAGAKVFMMPHGCLDPVKRAYHGGRKRLVGWLDRRAFARCDAVIATDARESEWVRAWAPSGTRVEVVPLGVDLPDETPPGDLPACWESSGGCRLLYVGRLHPLKGLEALLAALAEVPNVSLTVVGRDEQGQQARLERQCRAAGLADRVAFTGVVTDARKHELLAACEAFVLPSLSENFGLVVAEALAHGKPVIVTDGAPAWQEVPQRHCGWYLADYVAAAPNARVQALRAALESLAATAPEERAAMGLRGRQWMAADFTWVAVEERLAQLMRR